MHCSTPDIIDVAEPTQGKGRLVTATIAVALAAAALAILNLRLILPFASWLTFWALPESDIQALIFSQVALPRVAVSLLVGAGLSFAGVLIQQCLRNPLADTTTLGLSAGSFLAIAACAIFAPSLLDYGQPVVALGGASMVAMIILAIGRGSDFSPSVILLTGLSINLFCGAAAAALTVLNHEFLSGIFVWQSGNLVQNGWATALDLSWQFAALSVAAIFLARPLALMELGDEHARGLGVSVALLRASVLGLAIGFGAMATSSVGVIGFVGLAVPNVARMLGARTFREKLLWASLLGAASLLLADQSVQYLSFFRSEISTGSAVGLLGAPILLWLLGRTKLTAEGPDTAITVLRPRRSKQYALVVVFAVAFVVVLFGALMLGRMDGSWHVLGSAEIASISPWRLPRVIAAASSGALLAFAGTLLQRMTGNPMASPDVLGISSGAAMGVIGLLFLAPGFSQFEMAIAASFGAGATVAVIILLNARVRYSPVRLLLSGMAFATLFSALAATILASGDPRSSVLLAWMSGSTYRVTETTAVITLIAAIAFAAIVPWFRRWLNILPLGDGTARALGLNLVFVRVVLLLIIAISTGIACISTGPLTFVGLIAPHMARRMGFEQPARQILAACLIGGILLVLADWLGRNIVYPWQIPAGLISSMLGVPYFLISLHRRRGSLRN